MSFHFYLYRAPEGLPAINRWEAMHAAALGTADEVKERIAAVYPEIAWRKSGAYWLGKGPNGPGERYLDLQLTEEEPGNCRFVVLNKAAASVMRAIMEALALNYVCAPESGQLVDPYAYGDGDRYYAVRKQD